MQASPRFRKAGVTLGVGYAMEHAIILLRSILVARLIGPENFGLAATFLLIVSAFALISDLGIEKYIIHVRKSELASVQASLAFVLLARGLVLGSLIVIGSGWLAALFGQPDLAWMYACAALIPVIEGFRHLDPMRLQRDLIYIPALTVQLGSLIPGVILTVALAVWTEGYIAVVVGSIVTSLLSVVLSHLLSATRYRLECDRTVIAGLLAYGWPLVLNGVLILMGSQSDRVLIGALEGMRDLATYIATGTLTVGLSLFLAKLVGNLSLPVLSAVRDNPGAFAQKSRICGAATLVIISLTLMPMIVLGAPLVSLLFGSDYAAPAALAGFLSIKAAATVLRAWPVAAALSIGSTRDVLLANIIRITGPGAALLAVAQGHGAVGVAAGMAAGELASLLLALWRADRRTPGSAFAGLLFGGILCGLSGVALWLAQSVGPTGGWIILLLAAAAVSSLGIAATLAVSSEARQQFARAIRRIRRKDKT